MNKFFTPFYKSQEWQKLLEKEGYMGLSEQDKIRFVNCAVEDGHKKEYYLSLEFYQREGPDWEDLTEEQRENIREINRQHAREMQELGKNIGSMSQ